MTPKQFALNSHDVHLKWADGHLMQLLYRTSSETLYALDMALYWKHCLTEAFKRRSEYRHPDSGWDEIINDYARLYLAYLHKIEVTV